MTQEKEMEDVVTSKETEHLMTLKEDTENVMKRKEDTEDVMKLKEDTEDVIIATYNEVESDGDIDFNADRNPDVVVTKCEREDVVITKEEYHA